jgi:hypothetical protein
MSRPTFAALEGFLRRLGFEVRVVPESHVLFFNKQADVRIMLRLYQPDELVEPAGLISVRHTLDTWGLIGRDEFDKQIRNLELAR